MGHAFQDREFDIIVFGATGFTGRLVVEYLLETYGAENDLRWAIAGRNRSKLEQLRESLGSPQLPLTVADSSHEEQLHAMVQQTRVVCTTVGPYALYGSKLLASCAAHGTHYCDLTGEPPWMRAMIDAHEETARESGACIVHTCGFDSIPSDLGVLFLQNAMMKAHNTPSHHIKCRVSRMKGGPSGGTAATALHTGEQAAKDRTTRRLLANPYSLNPKGGPRGPETSDQTGAIYDEDFQRWTIPFVMASINTRVVRRSNALMEYRYGEDFLYDESMLTRKGQGALRSKLVATGITLGFVALGLGPLRALARRILPNPGEGPSRDEREAGFFEYLLYAKHPEDSSKDMLAKVTGDRDPGYGSTAKMLGESAVCLAKDPCSVGGGIWTPASAMGETLIERLQANAGMTFSILETPVSAA